MIVLCYARENKGEVERVYLALREAGLDPWMDMPPGNLSHILYGANWKYLVRNKIEEADYVLAFFSTSSVTKTGFIQEEYRLALDSARKRPPSKIYLIPVLLEKCELPSIGDGLVDFRSFHSFNLYERGIDDLLSQLAPEKKRKLDEVEEDARRLESEGLHFFASYFHLKSLFMSLRPPEVNVEKAMSCARRALVSIAREQRKSIYYLRTLRLFCKVWISILDEFGERFDGRDIWEIFGEGEIFSWLQDGGYPKAEVELFQDMLFIRSQLDLLEEIYVRAPAGLSTLRTCRLLLRAGFPPTLPGIGDRLGKIIEELVEESKLEGTYSLDDRCSLCTAVAVSCCALAGRHKCAEGAFTWLKGLGPERYSTRMGDSKRALHYAAMVLEAFLDYEYGTGVDEVVGKFFSVKCDGMGKYMWSNEWLGFRNVDRFEALSYILPAFLRLAIEEYDFGEGRNILAQVVDESVAQLVDEAKDAGAVHVWTLYASRDNLASLTLGRFVDSKDAYPIAAKISGLFHERIVEKMQKGGDHFKLLWDSSVDRTQNFIDGYLRYWEANLASREHTDRH